MKKVVLKVEVFDEKIKKKAMKAISGLEGLESIEMNMKDKKVTVIGDIDPVTVVAKLRKLCPTQLFTVGPAKEEPKKSDDNTKAALPMQVYPMSYYHQYQPPPMNYQNYYRSVGDDNGCVIC